MEKHVMNPSRILYILLLFVSLFYAFSTEDYFYPDETEANIVFEDFTFNESNYSIVSISGTASFLLKNGEVLKDRQDIANAINEYSNSFFPSQSELDNFTNTLISYNESRNNGDYFPNKEEYECKKVLLIDGKVVIAGTPITCTDEATCDFASKIVFSAYQKSVGWGGFPDAYNDLILFGIPSHNMDLILEKVINDAKSITKSNAGQKIQSIKDDIPTIKGYEAQIEGTKFRSPRRNDDADKAACLGKCYAMCPGLDLEEDQIGRAENLSSSLLSKIDEYNSKVSLSSTLYTQTMARFAYVEGEKNAVVYSRLYNPLFEQAEVVLKEGNEVSSLIVNDTLVLKIQHLNQLIDNINQSFEDRNFTTIDLDLDELEKLTQSVNETSPKVKEVYDNTVMLKDQAGVLMLVLESKGLPDESKSEFNTLNSLNANTTDLFRPGLSSSVYANMSKRFENIILKGNEILNNYKSTPVSAASLKLRGFARRVNDGFASISSSLNLMDLSSVKDNTLAILGGFSFLSFLSITAIMIFIVLIILASKSKITRIVKLGITVLLLLFIFGILVFSVFLYLNMEQAAFSADLDEFNYYFSADDVESLIVLDNKNVSLDVGSKMKDCSLAIAQNIENHNKSVTVLSLSDSVCTIEYGGNTTNNTKSTSFCKDKIDKTPSMILGYSAKNKEPVFLTSYETKAYLFGNAEYYDSCILKGLFE